MSPYWHRWTVTLHTRVTLALIAVVGCAHVASTPNAVGLTEAPPAFSGKAPDAAADTRAPAEMDASTTTKDGSGEPADAEDYGSFADDFERDAAALVLAHQTLAGPCVDPIAHTASGAHLKVPRKQWTLYYDTWLQNRDLDGDGQGDWVVEPRSSECDHALRLYVRRGDCGYFVGAVVGLDVDPMKSRTNDLHDVSVVGLSCPISHRKHYCRSIWKFDGHVYAPASERLEEAPRVPVEVDDPHAFCEQDPSYFGEGVGHIVAARDRLDPHVRKTAVVPKLPNL